MKEANFSIHAKQRLGERCSLSPGEVKRILDNDGTVVIHLQKGGRYAHRLFYSVADEEWFMIVQDGGDGGVLTVMPLEYLKGRTTVTAAHKRKARNRALALEKAASKQAEKKQELIPNVAPLAPAAPVKPLAGWKIQVVYIIEGIPRIKNIGRSLPEHGEPLGWNVLGPVHTWLKSRLVEFGIPVCSIRGFVASKGKITQDADGLLEFLPMTEDEIKMFR